MCCLLRRRFLGDRRRRTAPAYRAKEDTEERSITPPGRVPAEICRCDQKCGLAPLSRTVGPPYILMTQERRGGRHARQLPGDLCPVAARSRRFLGRSRRGAGLGAALGSGPRRRPPAVLSLVRGRPAEHLLQRGRPARRCRARLPARADPRQPRDRQRHARSPTASCWTRWRVLPARSGTTASATATA